MKGTGNTDIGKLRTTNEDYIFISNEPVGVLDNLYIVADGIGGHKAGDVASKKAIEFFVSFIQKMDFDDDDVLDLMMSALLYSNEQIYNISKTSKCYENMGTTFLATTIKDGKIYIIHIGDCRLYGIRNNKIVRMTTDHTYAMELFKAGVIERESVDTAQESSILTKALGTNSNVEADALFCDIFQDDIFIMCSDGLNTMVSDEQILLVAQDATSTTDEKVTRLIANANKNGGKDNIAIIIIQ